MTRGRGRETDMRMEQEAVSRWSKEGLWTLLGQVGLGIGWLLGIKLVTRFVSPEEFGRFSLGNTWINLVQVVFFSPAAQGLMRYWSIARATERQAAFATAASRFRKSLSVFALMTGLVLVGISWIMGAGDWAWLIVFSIAAGIAGGWFSIDVLVLTADRKRRLSSILNTGSACLRPLGAVLAVVVVAPAAEWAMLGFFLAAVLTAWFSRLGYRAIVPNVDRFRSNGPKVDTRALYRDIQSFSRPFLAWGLFAWVYQFSDRWALQMFHGPDVVGTFSVISQMAFYPLVFVTGLLQLYFMPIVYDRAGGMTSSQDMAAAGSILWRMMACYGLAVSGLTAIFILAGENLVILISDPQYLRYADLLPWLTVGWSLFFLGQLLTGFGMLANRSREYVPVIFCCSLLAAVLCGYLSWRKGPAGVVWGLGVAGVLYAGWNLRIARRMERKGLSAGSGMGT